MPADKRSFLMLQGPQSPFFKRLGSALKNAGHDILKINFCGGDVFIWHGSDTRMYRGSIHQWPEWVTQVMDERRVTDLILFGDRRSMQHEAIRLARLRGIRVLVLEEGYMQPGFITAELDGVNGRSSLPRTAREVQELAATLPRVPDITPIANSFARRERMAYFHHLGNTVLFGLFPRYRTHRPYPILWEVRGIWPRAIMRKHRRAWSLKRQDAVLNSGRPYFLFPLQLDSDVQVRHYSDYTGVVDSIAHVLSSFAGHAPKECDLLVKNHPIDNGLINYRKYVAGMSRAMGIQDRVHYMEEGDGRLLMRHCRAMVLINSSMGLEGLLMNKPVYCLGNAVYAIPGLVTTREQASLDEYWESPRAPDPDLAADLIKVLRHKALVNGNYYTDQGIESAVAGIMERLHIPINSQ